MNRSIMGSLATVAALTMISACSSPPGPEPGMPAPELPANGVAYDELKSTGERLYPFAEDCSQFTGDAAKQAGLEPEAGEIAEIGLRGCQIKAPVDAPFDGVQVHVLQTADQLEDSRRAFEQYWRFGHETAGHHKRWILNERYYAVTHLKRDDYRPSCEVVVDTGSKKALAFRGALPEDEARQLDNELYDKGLSSNIDQARADEFVAEHCPTVERSAEVLLEESIDPGGGSLATEP